MTLFSKERQPGWSNWAVESGVLLHDGEPSIDLQTVTQANLEMASRTTAYGVFLRSEDKKVLATFGWDNEEFARVGSEIFAELDRSVPQLQVRMRGGRLWGAVFFLIGVFALVAFLLVFLERLFSEAQFGWELLWGSLVLIPVGSFFTWTFYPWNAARFHATPAQAAKALKHDGRRVFFQSYE